MGGTETIRVLHVDDDPAFSDLAVTYLERADDRMIVDTATSGREGLERLSGAVDCVVSDYDMPDMDGLEFLEAVREEYPDLPFVLFTGKGSEEVASEAISAGVTDYLQKQIGGDQFTVLANRVSNAVGKYRLERETEWTRARLERQNDLFEKVQELASVGAWEYDRRTGETFLTGGVPRVKEVFPTDPEDATIEDVFELYHPDDRPALRTAFERARDEGEPFDLTVRLVSGVRDRRWVHTRGEPQYENGEVVRLRASFQDVTDRVERERDLERQTEHLQEEVERRKAAERRYRSLFENNPFVLWEEDFSAGKEYVDALAEEVGDLEAYLDDHPGEVDRLMSKIELLDVNQRALEYYGAGSKSELTNNLDELMVEESFEANKSLWTSVAAGETRFRTETVSRTLDGERRHEIVVVSVPDEHEDDYSRVYVTGTDVTDHKQRERELERKNERLDEFASLVSHDLRNPLEAANSGLELARTEFDSPHLDTIAEAHDRMAALIDDLLALARAENPVDPDTLDLVDLPTLVDTCWENAETGDARLVLDTESVVRADESRLRQLLQNLVRNAVEHGSRGSASTAPEGPDATDEPPVRIPVTVTVGDLDERSGFYVADDGPGIPEDEREAVFESGYSTDDDGTGFGFAIVLEIAKAHDWTVDVTESENGGARVEIAGVDVL